MNTKIKSLILEKDFRVASSEPIAIPGLSFVLGSTSVYSREAFAVLEFTGSLELSISTPGATLLDKQTVGDVTRISLQSMWNEVESDSEEIAIMASGNGTVRAGGILIFMPSGSLPENVRAAEPIEIPDGGDAFLLSSTAVTGWMGLRLEIVAAFNSPIPDLPVSIVNEPPPGQVSRISPLGPLELRVAAGSDTNFYFMRQYFSASGPLANPVPPGTTGIRVGPTGASGSISNACMFWETYEFQDGIPESVPLMDGTSVRESLAALAAASETSVATQFKSVYVASGTTRLVQASMSEPPNFGLSEGDLDLIVARASRKGPTLPIEPIVLVAPSFSQPRSDFGAQRGSSG